MSSARSTTRWSKPRSWPASKPTAEVRIEVLPEPTNFFESLFGDMEAEKEMRIGQGLESVAPELVNIARQAARALRKVFDRPAAFVMPFELEIR